MQDARPRSLALLVLAAGLLTGCDVEWGGAHLSLETPPARDTAGEEEERPEAERLPPMPAPPLLYVVRSAPGGGARAMPIARLEEGSPAPLGWPDDPPEAWLERFTADFLAPGTELPLYSRGRRLGSVILDAVDEPVNAGCPAVASARLLVPPGAPVPPWSFAHAAGSGTRLPGFTGTGEPTRRMLTFGPILAERLFRGAGEDRPYLATPAEIVPVPLPRDTVPAMAATYMIRDTLAAVAPPEGSSASLFFVARHREGSGYEPVWSRVERYGAPSGKTAFAHLDWLTMEGPDLEVLRRVTADGEGLAIARVEPDADEGEVAWVEGDRCPALGRLGGGG